MFDNLRYLWTNAFPPKPTWTTDKIPDLTGKVTIVTGANTGIGKETAKSLLQHNAKVYVAARNSEKAAKAIADLRADTGKEAHFLKLDLGDLKSVKASAEEFSSKEEKLDILFNNGGVMMPPIKELTTDGYDLQFGTNVIGHFYFTKLLLPRLIAGAQSSADKKARVVNTSSYGHTMHPALNFNTFKDSPARVKLGATPLYGQSKFGNIVFSNELARRYGDQGIVSTSCHPGMLDTELGRHLPQVLMWLAKWMLHSATMGAVTQLRAGTSPEGTEWNGKYLIPWARVAEPHKNTKNETLWKELWEYLEEQTKDI